MHVRHARPRGGGATAARLPDRRGRCPTPVGNRRRPRPRRRLSRDWARARRARVRRTRTSAVPAPGRDAERARSVSAPAQDTQHGVHAPSDCPRLTGGNGLQIPESLFSPPLGNVDDLPAATVPVLEVLPVLRGAICDQPRVCRREGVYPIVPVFIAYELADPSPRAAVPAEEDRAIVVARPELCRLSGAGRDERGCHAAREIDPRPHPPSAVPPLGGRADDTPYLARCPRHDDLLVSGIVAKALEPVPRAPASRVDASAEEPGSAGGNNDGGLGADGDRQRTATPVTAVPAKNEGGTEAASERECLTGRLCRHRVQPPVSLWRAKPRPPATIPVAHERTIPLRGGIFDSNLLFPDEPYVRRRR